MDKKVFKKGEVIFSKGRPSDCMYGTPKDFDDYFKTKPAKVMLILRNMSSRLRGQTEEGWKLRLTSTPPGFDDWCREVMVPVHG